MAKSANTIDDALKDITKDYKKAAAKAAAYATEKVMEDLKGAAFEGLKRYYSGYHPSSHNRKNRLKESIVTYSNIKASGDTLNCRMEISFDSSRLAGLYDDEPSRYYRGESVPQKIDYDIIKTKDKKGKTIEKQVPWDIDPINVWIMNNFLEGTHPYTDGGREVNAKYQPNGSHSTVSTEYLVNKKLIEIDEQNKFTDYLLQSFFEQIL